MPQFDETGAIVAAGIARRTVVKTARVGSCSGRVGTAGKQGRSPESGAEICSGEDDRASQRRETCCFFFGNVLACRGPVRLMPPVVFTVALVHPCWRAPPTISPCPARAIPRPRTSMRSPAVEF